MLFFLCGLSHQAKAQWVLVPDSNMRDLIDYEINQNQGPFQYWNGNYIDSTDLDVKSVLSLDTEDNSNSDTIDITGIEALTNLVGLRLGDFVYTPFLPQLPNKIQNIDAFQHDILYITNFPDSLQFIECTYNKLTTLPPFNNALVDGRFGSNLITSLPSSLGSIQILSLENNQLTSLPVLPSSLLNFGVSNNHLTSLPTLPNSLINFNCSGNNITSIPSLPPNLKSLSCDHNPLTSFPASFPNSLIYINCQNNQISTLPSLPSGLQLLVCDSNMLTVLPLLPITLRTLSCAYNQISIIPPVPLPLNSIFCNNNQLTSLPNFLDSINTINCSNNPNLTCLPNFKTYYNGIGHLDFLNTGITCIPNYIHVYGGQPRYDSLPLCDYLNPNSCTPYWNVAGRAYFDSNIDCSFNAGDLMQPNAHLLFYKGTLLQQQTFTEGAGFYSFLIDTASTYVTQLDSINYPFTSLCPANSKYTNALSFGVLKPNNDFSLKCKNGVDIGVWGVYANELIPGHLSQIKVNAGDYSQKFGGHCSNGASGSISIIIKGNATFISADSGALTPSVINGDTLIYNVPDFGNINYKTAFNFIIKTDTIPIVDSLVCFRVTVSLDPLDNNPTNNSFCVCYKIRSSFDPNEKSVYPNVKLDINGDRLLTYTIDFQNTGTAPADNIYILDTLDENLDLVTLQLLSYSHQPFLQVLEGGIAKFNFRNINLPDSTNDEPHSHGYVQYSIKAKLNLLANTQIKNTAHIVFDYNIPVVTNTATNTILNCPQNNQNLIVKLCTKSQYYYNGLTLTHSGTYTSKFLTSNGCDSIVELQLVIGDTAVSIFADSLTALASNSSYQWIDCSSNSLIVGATSQKFIPLISGNYAVIISSGNCTDTSSCHFISLTSLQENILNKISISPNPTKDQFIISCPKVLNRFLTIDVYDPFGKLIQEKLITSESTILNSTSWPSGIYFMEIKSGDSIITRKLVKE